MIKRIIFDLDNTLINWLSNYECYDAVLKRLDIDYDDEMINKIGKSSYGYESKHIVLTKKAYLRMINVECDLELPMEFVDYLLEEEGKKVPDKLPDEVHEILEYLSKKYDLVILTNWYYESQIERLKRVKIDKYFTEVYAGNDEYLKPHEKSYLRACGEYKPEECIMIDDSEKNIEGALRTGLEAMLYNPNKKSKKNKTLKEIKRLYDLKNAL